MTQHKKITFIDFAKGFAIFTIVVMHYFQRMPVPGWMAKGVLLGGTGIHVFILLSGFGLILGRYQGWMAFLQRRASKILLPYYFFITLLFILNFFVVVHPDMDGYAYLGNLFFFQLIDERIVYVFGIQFWFISTILQLYLLFPVLRIGLQKLGAVKFSLVCLFISSLYFMILYFTGAYQSKVWSRLFPQYLWEFGLGMALAHLYQVRQFQFWNMAYHWLILGFLGGFGTMALLTFYLGDLGVVINDIPAMVGYLSATILLYRLSVSLIGFIESGFLFIGKYSYPLYLVHIAVLSLWLHFVTITRPLPLLLAFFLIYLLAALVASVIYDKLYAWVYHRLSRKQSSGKKNI